MSTQSVYQKAIAFAALKHAQKKQMVPGTEQPYVVHLSNVAMELFFAFKHSDDFDLGFAIQLAFLHDTIEDTHTTYEELSAEFGTRVADGVAALSKNESLPKKEAMLESLNKIKRLEKEVWMVKLADRITNLQPPPSHWDNDKKILYKEEAKLISEMLNGANGFLERRLLEKIEEYERYIES